MALFHASSVMLAISGYTKREARRGALVTAVTQLRAS
jgi:hypothetical protein